MKATFDLSNLRSLLIMFVFPAVSFPVSSLTTIQACIGSILLSRRLALTFSHCIGKLAFDFAFRFLCSSVSLGLSFVLSFALVLPLRLHSADIHRQNLEEN